MKTSLGIFLVVQTILTTFTLSAQSYTIDAGHSNVQINVKRFGMVDVVGRFKEVVGMITYQKEEPSLFKADVVIKVNSYDANNLGGEQAVKSKVFLDASNYPEIRFQGNSAESKDDYLLIKGKLSIHGTTREVILPLRVQGPLLDIPTKKQSISLHGTIVINRQDYGISFNKKLPNGTPIVGDEVKITLNVLALGE